MTGTTAHLSEAEIVGTVLGDLNSEAIARRDAHALDCPDCARRLERLRARRPRPRMAPAPSSRPDDTELGAEDSALLLALAAPRTLEQLAAEHAAPHEAFVGRVEAVRRLVLDECPRLLHAVIAQVEHSTEGAGLDPLHVGLYRAVFLHDDDAAFRRTLNRVAHRVGSERTPEWSVEPSALRGVSKPEPRARRLPTVVLLTAVGGWLAAAVALLMLRPTLTDPSLATDPDIQTKGAVVAPALTVVCVPAGAEDLSDVIRTQGPSASCPKDSEIGASVTVPGAEWQTLVVVFSQAGYKDIVMHREAGTLQTLEFDPETSPEGRRVLLRSKLAVSLLSSRGPDASTEHHRIVISPSKNH